jgi:hypothetical protein
MHLHHAPLCVLVSVASLLTACGPSSSETGSGGSSTGSETAGGGSAGSTSPGGSGSAGSTDPGGGGSAGSTDPGGGGSAGSTNPGGGGSGGAVVAKKVPCDGPPVDHSAACTAPCPLTVDLNVFCNDSEFAAPGLSVAPGPDATWLLTTSAHDRMLIKADAAGVTRVGDDVLPNEFVRSQLLFGRSPKGELHVVGDTRQPPYFDVGGVQDLAFDGASWTQTAVLPEAKKSFGAQALAIGSDGALHLWSVRWSPDTKYSAKHAWQDAAGSWSVGDMPLPQDATDFQFALTADGQPASFGSADLGVDGWTLQSEIGGVQESVGSGAKSPSVLYFFRFLLAEGPLVPGGPAFAALTLHPEALHVVWPQGGSYQEIALAGSAPLYPTCAGSGMCDSICHETASGVEDGAMAIARTEDGTLWVGFAVHHLDMQFHYTPCGPNPGDCGYCVGSAISDNSTTTFHLVRVPTDGSAPQEVLALPIDELALDVWQGLFDGTKHAVAMRGAGEDVAIGLRTKLPPNFNQPVSQVRLLRVDTSQIAK